MLQAILFTIFIVCASGVFIGMLAEFYFFIQNMHKKMIRKNNRGNIALIAMAILWAFGMVAFIVEDAQMREKIKPVQIAVQTREADPNDSN